jgi:hypothetical protein
MLEKSQKFYTELTSLSSYPKMKPINDSGMRNPLTVNPVRSPKVVRFTSKGRTPSKLSVAK